VKKDGKKLTISEPLPSELSDESVEESVKQTEAIISEAAKSKQPNISQRG